MKVIRWLTGTFTGRALALGLIIKVSVLLITTFTGSSTPLLEVIDTCGSVSLVVAAIGLAVRLTTRARRGLLWRVRRKLTLSYIFIGFVPALLIIMFFCIAGLLLFFNVSAYMLQGRIETLVEQTRGLGELAALELRQTDTAAVAARALERSRSVAARRHPGASYAVVAAPPTCIKSAANDPRSSNEGAAAIAKAGKWEHVEPPKTLPAWIPCEGFAGLTTHRQGDRINAAARAIAPIGSPASRYVVVDVPLDRTFIQQASEDTGLTLESLAAREAQDEGPVDGVPSADPDPNPDLRRNIRIGPATIYIDPGETSTFEWLAFINYPDWATGQTQVLLVTFGMDPLTVYRRLSGTAFAEVGDFSFNQLLLVLLAVVAALFLIIQGVAFTMGFVLARSVTGAVHELFVGTERVRRGDFTHKIAVRSRDQLGELAESFNSMTGSIGELLQQKAEKERLEQELRIAREIQMSLLPQGSLTMPGLALAGHCEPAREVGGDYYDFVPIDEHRLGILIADVAGKGTSAAFYMAELKGIVLSLSQQHRSPRQLLIDANRIISHHLDSRSFITMTYAVVDLEARTLTHARAGHCPLIHLPGPGSATRTAQVLAPDGLVLGLRIDDGELFNRLLTEETRPICAGDLFLLYTDGVTEAMNADGDLFGEGRLSRAIECHCEAPFEQLRDKILEDIHTFVGAAPQQDDLTMVLLKVEELPALSASASALAT